MWKQFFFALVWGCLLLGSMCNQIWLDFKNSYNCLDTVLSVKELFNEKTRDKSIDGWKHDLKILTYHTFQSHIQTTCHHLLNHYNRCYICNPQNKYLSCKSRCHFYWQHKILTLWLKFWSKTTDQTKPTDFKRFLIRSLEVVFSKVPVNLYLLVLLWESVVCCMPEVTRLRLVWETPLPFLISVLPIVPLTHGGERKVCCVLCSHKQTEACVPKSLSAFFPQLC